MPSLPAEDLVRLTGQVDGVAVEVASIGVELVKRVTIPINSTTPPELIEAIKQDAFHDAEKYGLLFVYIGIILVVTTAVMRLYYYWGDKIRTALFKEEVINSATTPGSMGFSPAFSPGFSPHRPFPDYELPSAQSGATESSTQVFFPATGPLVREKQKQQAAVSAIAPLNNTIAFFRSIFYRPIPTLKVGPFRLTFLSPGFLVIVVICLTASMLYCFVPQPYFYRTMAYGSPPLAIRAGMISISILPWMVALATKANPISFVTGIGHERLIVLHRWAAYLFVIFAIIHAVPYWYQSMQDPEGFATFKLYFQQQYYIFTTGIAALVPLLFLTLHSLPILRHKAYEFFVILHIPVAWGFMGLLFWHTHNYLNSWAYLYSTIVLLILSLLTRLFFLNWMNPLRSSWLIGEESAVTILPEGAIKVTIPTQKRWRPGQYVYLRMPGVALLDNHPFTIASLCSEDFPSSYGDAYRDMMVVFRPFKGFTRKVFETATKKGPYKTYRAFVEGPYGGMQREMASFSTVVFFAGGSGITAIASQLLDLIKRMRDGKATTTKIHVIWAMKRPDIMEWFKEELRICRECAPPGTVQCHFFITASKRVDPLPEAGKENRLSGIRESIHNKIVNAGSKRNSALLEAEEEKDNITALPQAFLAPPRHGGDKTSFANRMSSLSASQLHGPAEVTPRVFDFGFPSTPTKFQKNLMRFAFLPTNLGGGTAGAPGSRRDGWRTEYGRPDIPYMLKNISKEFGRRTCVYVCGPPEMREDVSRTVAGLQNEVWRDSGKDEIHLHAENYAI